MRLISFTIKMAKVRKSREQKIKAQLRHFDYHYEIPTAKLDTIKVIATPNLRTQTISYPYLKNDLLKTLVVTGAILGLQIATFILLKNNTISILGIGY